VLDFENETIEAQRAELQLLVAELHGRDRELNEMVARHRLQTDAWQLDRSTAVSLQQSCSQLHSQF